ncbi:hypothetical protein NQZ79_g2516 [Umbelopsis isabellina]|nr:hypothetical protein NQZ79_g2516 [Umbelopsis isabellina]
MQDYKQSPQSSQSSQTPPPPPPLPSGWIAQWDETHNRYFYANTVTGQTQWELPTEPATPGGGESNAYQGAPPEYSQVDPKQSPSSSSDRGLGSFMSSAMGGGRPQNGYGNQYQSGYGGGYPNNGGYSNSGNSGFPGGGSMGGMIAGSLMGLVAGRVLGNDHRHQRPGLIGSFLAPALPNGGFMGPQYGNPYGSSYYQDYGRHGRHHHGHHHHHNHHHRW